jgi:superoxide dismutase, Fe-Mn family
MYQAKNYDHLLGINGLSEGLMKNHFTLYQGYVTNTNKIIEQLMELMKQDKMAAPEFAELKRRMPWEFNGMRLHEYFFGAMVKDYKELDKEAELYQKIVTDFGSYDNWQKDFKATAMMRGIGWVILYYDQEIDRLINVWVNEHDVGHLAGAKLLLNLYVFEHAFMLDRLKRPDYVETFFKLIDWEAVDKRFKDIK